MRFFGLELSTGDAVTLRALRLTTAALLPSPSVPDGDAHAHLYVGDQLVCRLTLRDRPNAALSVNGEALQLRCTGTPGCTVHICGYSTAIGQAGAAPAMGQSLPPPPPPIPMPCASKPGKTSLNFAAELAMHLVAARRAVLCDADSRSACAAIRVFSTAVMSRGDDGGDSEVRCDARAAFERDAVARCDEAVAVLTEENVRRISPTLQLHALDLIDRTFFQLIFLCLVDGDPCLSLSTTLAAYEDAQHDAMQLLREPALFFLRSHAPEWIFAQHARWAAMTETARLTFAQHDAQPASQRTGAVRSAKRPLQRELSLEATTASSAAAAPTVNSASWLGQVVTAHYSALFDAMRAGASARDGASGSHVLAVREGVPQLLALWVARQLEAVALLHADSLSAELRLGFDTTLSPSASSMRDEDPPAPRLVKDWRRAERSWPCWLFAFAVPSMDALDLLAAHGPYVEIGAGTGYWAAFLHERGVKVTAFDARPPSRGDSARRLVDSDEEARNEYHAGVPTYVPISKGGPEQLARREWREHTLLMCYPPPRDRMAFDSLRAFCGNRFAHVGEWLGDTGNAAFERELFQNWRLERRLALPCWGDTTEDLTLWRRRGQLTGQRAVRAASGAAHDGAVRAASGAAHDGVVRAASGAAHDGAVRAASGARRMHPFAHPLLKCCGPCGQHGLQGLEVRTDCDRPPTGEPPVLLRRCRYCRLATYCSASCAAADADAHEQLHVIKMIMMKRPLDFEGRDYFDLRKPFVD